jgi:hypothetical protein
MQQGVHRVIRCCDVTILSEETFGVRIKASVKSWLGCCIRQGKTRARECNGGGGLHESRKVLDGEKMWRAGREREDLVEEAAVLERASWLEENIGVDWFVYGSNLYSAGQSGVLT